MANPSLTLRGGPSGPTFDPSTPGYLLSIDTDGKSVKPIPASTGPIDASEVVNDSNVPGLTVADALNGAAFTAGNSGATKNLSYLDGNVQKLTLTANCTVTITNLPATPAWIELEVTQDGTGSRTLAIATAKTPNAAGLTLSTAPASLDIVDIYWNGTALRAAVAGLAFA